MINAENISYASAMYMVITGRNMEGIINMSLNENTIILNESSTP